MVDSKLFNETDNNELVIVWNVKLTKLGVEKYVECKSPFCTFSKY